MEAGLVRADNPTERAGSSPLDPAERPEHATIDPAEHAAEHAAGDPTEHPAVDAADQPRRSQPGPRCPPVRSKPPDVEIRAGRRRAPAVVNNPIVTACPTVVFADLENAELGSNAGSMWLPGSSVD